MASEANTEDRNAASLLIKNDADYPHNQVVQYYIWKSADSSELSQMIDGENLSASADGLGLSGGIYDPLPISSYINSALSILEEQTNINFTEISKSQLLSSDNQQVSYLSFALIDSVDYPDSHLRVPLPNSGNSLILFEKDRIDERALFFTIHELLHALGLEHPHAPGNPLAGGEYDSQKYTIMSYQGHESFDVTPEGNYLDAPPQSLMLLDYLAFHGFEVLGNYDSATAGDDTLYGL
jgi:hypothetical protein